MNKTALLEEFGEYLRENWDERETLPVGEWWLNKVIGIIEGEILPRSVHPHLAGCIECKEADAYNAALIDVLDKLKNNE